MASALRYVDRVLRGQWVDETPPRPATRGDEFTGAWLHTPVGRQAFAGQCEVRDSSRVAELSGGPRR